MPDDHQSDHQEIFEVVLLHLLTRGGVRDLEKVCAGAGLPALYDCDEDPVSIEGVRTYHDAGLPTAERGLLVKLSDGSQITLTLKLGNHPFEPGTVRMPGAGRAAPDHPGNPAPRPVGLPPGPLRGSAAGGAGRGGAVAQDGEAGSAQPTAPVEDAAAGARAAAPCADLTGYLTGLADQVGFRVQLAELDPACGHHPELVLAWVAAGARHAGLTYARGLLGGAFEFLHEQVNSPDLDARVVAEAMLCQLYHHDEQLSAALAEAGRGYATASTMLAGTGLTQPKTT